MRHLLERFFARFIAVGRLSVRWPDGSMTQYGSEAGSGANPVAGLVLRDAGAIRGLVVDPEVAVGELYMAGRLLPDACSIYDLLDLLLTNTVINVRGHPILSLRDRWNLTLRRLAQFNPAPRVRERNVAHHYDLNGRLYSLFLDRDRQYSCAYFPTGTETLEQAQIAKKRHIAAKLKLDRPDLDVLDIGCGWGGMALTLARDYGARVTGITLSSEQLAEARARAVAEGLADRVRFEMLDYRSLPQCSERPFDRIVSVGMFEHVGVVHYKAFFQTVKRMLAPSGVALLHTIGRSNGPSSTSRWITKYIFPGGYSPALSEVLPEIERSGLMVTDVEVLRLHYAETIRHWRRRFAANRDAITTLYDERFCRMFEFYLCGAELAFRRQDHVNFQIQLVRDRCSLPLARDYMYEVEHQVAHAREDA